MNRIQRAFGSGKKFVGYITAGDGGIARSLEAALALISGGVDILEVAVPFSDPVADGPTIQMAMSRALAGHTTIEDTLRLIQQIREHTDIPIILFSYVNPVYIAAKNGFLAKAAASGVDGILLVDLPLEESTRLFTDCRAAGIEPIFLITPSTEEDRIKLIDQSCNSFLYYVCRKGTTGVKQALPVDIALSLQRVKSLTTNPIVAGFGIADKKSANEILDHVNGFVIGSKFVDAIAEGKSAQELTDLAKALDPRDV